MLQVPHARGKRTSGAEAGGNGKMAARRGADGDVTTASKSKQPVAGRGAACGRDEADVPQTLGT